jgi:hypothetical protein
VHKWLFNWFLTILAVALQIKIMKQKLLLAVSALVLSATGFAQNAQNNRPTRQDSLQGFNVDSVINMSVAARLEPWEHNIFIRISEERFLDKKYSRSNRNQSNPVVTPQAPCTNTGFETGDFTGWTGAVGDNNSSSLGPLQNIAPGIFTGAIDPAVTDASARHSLMTAAAGNDDCGAFPIVPASGGYGTYVARIGNSSANYQGEYLEQTFTVDPTNTQFSYRYAVVLYDGGHLANEQSYFKIEMLDSVGNPVSACAQYYVAASSSIIGFNNCVASSQFFNTLYRPWTTVSFDLSGYVGQNVTVRFTAAGCIYGGHFGYAYIDCACSSIADAVSATFCPGGPGAFLVAPAGFGDYQWFYPNGSAIVGATNDSLFVPNANAGDTFSVEMHAIADTSCVTILNVVVDLTILQTSITGVDPLCFGESSGSATSSCSNCVLPITYSWNSSPTQSTATATGLPSGTYIVSFTDSLGCPEQDTVTLVDPPRTDTSGITTQFCFGDEQITLIGIPGMPSYQWLDAQGLPIAGETSQTLIVNGPQVGQLYYCVYNTVPCPTTDSIIVNYVPPTPLFSPDSTVNVFTPNGDGKNDYFYPFFDQTVFVQNSQPTQPAYDFTLLYVGSYEIWIYDRWGAEVFYSNDYQYGWDGKVDGKDATEGVYYFVTKFTSRCDLDMEPITNKGFVHLKK